MQRYRIYSTATAVEQNSFNVSLTRLQGKRASGFALLKKANSFFFPKQSFILGKNFGCDKD
jgi:hypothetical protein